MEHCVYCRFAEVDNDNLICNDCMIKMNYKITITNPHYNKPMIKFRETYEEAILDKFMALKVFDCETVSIEVMN